MKKEIECKNSLLNFIRDDGSAAKSHLAEGRPIFYCDDSISEKYIIREWPSGQRELIQVSVSGEVNVISEIRSFTELETT